MTENKRFRISQGYTDRFCHDWQNNQLLNFRETVDLLNELAEENQQLRQLLDIGETNAKDIVDVLNMQQRENKELKQSIHDWQGSYDDLYEDNLKLEKENKELKKELGSFKPIIFKTENGATTLYEKRGF